MADDPTKRTQRDAQRPLATRPGKAKLERSPKRNKKDFSQIALSIVQKVTGAKPLKRKRRSR